ncbi:restriction endonuclease subunit S [Priestia megaterium]|uniref:restriction endonuclease subunit S n=1 Tax=Priestia megaterium TaxID=1404 RepID=UPI0023DC8DAB|nr:restriction endonuclease subunit S [Priestia megaterium]MDF2015558.1 restriction endonuclease subunit S [Priestia megaterium]
MSKKKKTIDEVLKEIIVGEKEHPYRLPDNWVWVKFDSVIKTSRNQATAIKQKDYEEEGIIPVIDQGKRLISGFTNNENYLYTGELPIIVFGDHTKCFKWIDFKFAQGADGTKLLKPLEKLYPKYFYYIFKLVNLPDKGYSRHFKYLRDITLPIPPLNEQKRVVEKLDELLQKIEDAKQLIEEAKETFELRRAAILDKAFRGELTRKWRRNNYGELEDNYKKKNISNNNYINLDDETYVNVLHEIPESWNWIPLKQFESKEQLVLTGPFGTTLSKKDFTSEGVPVLTIGCLTDNGISLNKANYVSEEKANQLKRYRLRKGDILFSRMATVGRASLVDETFENALINYHIMRLRLPQDLNIEYFLQVVKGASSTKRYLKNVNHGATRDGINTKQLLDLPIPYPSLAEQKQIVEQISVLFDKENVVSEELEKNKIILDNLQQTILSKAFRGELGTNEPSEESAIELLKEVLQEQVK